MKSSCLRLRQQLGDLEWIPATGWSPCRLGLSRSVISLSIIRGDTKIGEDLTASLMKSWNIQRVFSVWSPKLRSSASVAGGECLRLRWKASQAGSSANR